MANYFYFIVFYFIFKKCVSVPVVYPFAIGHYQPGDTRFQLAAEYHSHKPVHPVLKEDK